ncbi:hypothetical protein [Halalkalibacter urbisdiaboli]|uniref:hypothetical protein n=1 Tax=Halalkalibacter urbisdiaboli TaxID=1960589 RepID=UPI000B44C3BA|nr:hypothetical protein [Halalkalibacter urbisdiaboli]
MNKSVSQLVLVFSILFLALSSGATYANTKDKPRPFEEIFPENGYKTVEEAVREFEQHFNQDLKLPLRVPPVSFTHHFAKFNDTSGERNDSFEMKYLSDESPENNYKIYVRPIKHKIPIKDKRVVKLYNLKNGKQAKFINISESFEALVFERDNWQYMLSISKKISDKVTPEMLVEIANSIDYPSEKKNPLE